MRKWKFVFQLNSNYANLKLHVTHYSSATEAVNINVYACLCSDSDLTFIKAPCVLIQCLTGRRPQKMHFIHIKLLTSVNKTDTLCSVIRFLSHLWLSMVLNVWMCNVMLPYQLSVIGPFMCRRMEPCRRHGDTLTDLMKWQTGDEWRGSVITGEEVTEQRGQCQKDTRLPTIHPHTTYTVPT